MKRIIITGATGLIGSNIASKLIERGDEVIVFSRSPKRAMDKIAGAYDYIKWDYDLTGGWENSVGEADAVIHLAGENVMGGRWTDLHKKKVLESRVNGTRNLVDAICKENSKPEVLICASAVGYYDNNINLEVDENSRSGNGFLSNVTEKWEEEAAEVERCDVRHVSIRTGIVLSKTDGALAKMIFPFMLFIGGPLGSGKQWMPWIHIDDITNLFIYSIDNKINGIFNGVSPGIVRMKKFAVLLGKALHRPALLKVPEFVLNIILGEAAGAVTKGSKVIPKRTLEASYKFVYEDLEEALNDILKG